MKSIILTSRPRFWMYTAGPYLLGITAAGFWTSLENVWLIALFALFFIFPANLFIYGINDIFDGDTDALNDKKSGYETKVTSTRGLINMLALIMLPFMIFVPFMDVPVILSMFAFLFFSFFYSAKPIRAKAVPFMDASFNVLYVLPGVFAYLLAGGTALSPLLMLSGWAWCIAMHVYSAVPDIVPDTAAGIKTTATALGTKHALLYSLFFFILAIGLTFTYLGWLTVPLTLVYTSMILISFTKKTSEALLGVYRWFPYVNGLVGMVLFFTIYFY